MSENSVTTVQSVIDLGSYGKLISPVNVDGDHWYYYWDLSGDGTSADIGSLNSGRDSISHDALDAIFTQDINGAINVSGNTTDVYRYANLNGVRVALPTVGGVAISPYGVNSLQTYASQTAIGDVVSANGSLDVNPTYNDYLAVWDAYNGTGVGGHSGGTPPGWAVGFEGRDESSTNHYLTATQTGSTHVGVTLWSGYVGAIRDIDNFHVALEVFNPPIIQSAIVMGDTITLQFNQPLDPAHQPSSSYFSVDVSDDTHKNVTGYAISGQTVVLKTSTETPAGSILTITYQDPTAGDDLYSIQSNVGVDVPSFSVNTTAGVAASDTIYPIITSLGTDAIAGEIHAKFSEPIQFSNSSWSITSSALTPITVTSVNIIGTSELVIHTVPNSFASNDYLLVKYLSGDIHDLASTPHYLSPGYWAVGSEGVDSINTSTLTSIPLIRGNGGNDVIIGGYGNETIIPAGGADTVTPGGGTDLVYLKDSYGHESDTIKIGVNDSRFNWYDTLYGFDTTTTGAGNDVLSLPSTVIADNTYGNLLHDGSDVGSFSFHTINSGIINLYGADRVAILVNSSNQTSAVSYLSANITAPAATVGLPVDTDANGYADSLFVFQDGVPGIRNIGNSDIAVLLRGVNGVTLSTNAGHDVVQITDSVGPGIISGGQFTFSGNTTTWDQEWSEPVAITGTGPQTSIFLNGVGGNILTGQSVNGNHRIMTVGSAIAPGDWLLSVTGNEIQDLSGKNSINAGTPAFIGLDGDSVINLSGISDPAVLQASTRSIRGFGGHDQITGTAASDFIVGGPGADIIDGGAGADSYIYYQGDSPTISLNLALGNNISGLDDGDQYSFVDGRADVISAGFTVTGIPGLVDYIALNAPPNGNGLSNQTGAPPSEGTVQNQKFFLVQGNYTDGTFVVAQSTAGHDTMVVYDGDASNAISQTGLVIQGHTLGELRLSGSTIFLDSTAPVALSSSWGGSVGTVVTVHFDEALDPQHVPSASYFDFLASDGSRRGVSTAVMSVSGSDLLIPLNSQVPEGLTLTVSYKDPSQANDLYALQDMLGNDVSSANWTITAPADGAPHLAPALTFAAVTDEAQGTIRLNFDKPVTVSDATLNTLVIKDVNLNPYATVTSIDGSGTSQLVLHTSANVPSHSLTSDHTFLLQYTAGTNGIKNLQGGWFTSGTVVIDGAGSNVLDLSLRTSSSGAFNIRGNDGDDVITGSNGGESILPGEGADVVNAWGGSDGVGLSESVRKTDTVVFSLNGAYGHSTISSPDGISSFDVTAPDGINNDRLSLPYNAIAADTEKTPGVATGVFVSHSISAGKVTLFDVNSAIVPITDLNKVSALTYLQKTLGIDPNRPGGTVSIDLDDDHNGASDSMLVFQDEAAGIANAGNADIAILLRGVNGATLSTTAGQNLVQLVDDTPPLLVGGSSYYDIGNGASYHQFFTENVQTYSAASSYTEVYLNGTGSNVALSSQSFNGNERIIPLSISPTQTDWVTTITVADVMDMRGNVLTPLPSIGVIGSQGANNIVLTNLSYAGKTGFTVRAAAGDDSIIGGNGNDFISGGIGADLVNGGLGSDTYAFIQGDSPQLILNLTAGDTNKLDNGDVFSFAGGLGDLISGGFEKLGSKGDSIWLPTIPERAGLHVQYVAGAATGSAPAPENGLVSDQAYFMVQGSYGNNGNFTVNTITGQDTLVVYDGNPVGSGAGNVYTNTSATGVVLLNHVPGQLTASGISIFLTDFIKPHAVNLTQLGEFVGSGADLTISFDEYVKFGLGNLAIHTDVPSGYAQPMDRVISVYDSQLSFSSNQEQLLIHPTTTLPIGTRYTVSWDQGFLTDATGNQIDAGNTRFQSSVISHSTDTINEGGAFQITVQGSTDLANQQISYSLSGENITDADFIGTPMTGTVLLDETGRGVINLIASEDRALEGPEFAQLNVAGTSLSFTINDTSYDAIAPELIATQPLDNATGVGMGTNIRLSFTEAVQLGSGKIRLVNDKDHADDRIIDVTSGQVSVSGTDLVINPTVDLKPGAHYAVTLDGGVVKDLAGNPNLAMGDLSRLDFTIGKSSYTVGATPSSVNEGQSVSFVLETFNVAAGARLNYALSGISQADLQAGGLSGYVIVGDDHKATLSVGLLADDKTEASAEALSVKFYAVGVSAAVATASVAVNDTSKNAQVSLSVDGATSSNEDSLDGITYHFHRDGAASGAMKIGYTIGGSAKLGTDYVLQLADASGHSLGVATAGAVNFGVGEHDVFIKVKTIADTVYEADETVSVSLNAAAGYSLGSSRTATTNILNDDYTGTLAADVINGNAGANTLLGKAGADKLYGRDGNDTLNGGAGKDLLDGGNGADLFLFDQSGQANVDTIVKFEKGSDKLGLSLAFFRGLAGSAESALNAEAFYAGSAAHDSTDRIIFNKATKTVFYDSDGNGSAAQVEVAVLTNILGGSSATLDAEDFLLKA